jgi:flagellar hook-basal body complex protein FliE
MPIDPIASPALGGILGPAAPGAPAAAGFGESLNRMLSAVDSTAAEANTAVSNMMQGTGDVHEAMIALQRSEMTLQLTVQVRNKLVSAYQEIMRMSI